MGLTKIESPEVIVNKHRAELFTWVSDARNFEHIMPDQVISFKGEENRFKFGLKGLPEVGLNIIERNAPEQLVMEDSSGKIGFKLFTILLEAGENQTKVQLIVEGSFNPMMKMMIEKPLRNFISDLSEKIAQL